MPEAVASNSTPAPEGQAKRKIERPAGIPPCYDKFYFKKLPPYVSQGFEAIEEMLKAHGVMVAAVMERGDDFSLYANGVHMIYRLILLRLDAIVNDVDERIEEMEGRQFVQGKSSTELLERIGAMVAAAYTASGVEMDLDTMLEWSKEMRNVYFGATSNYFRELEAKMEGDNHLLTAGSLLPWLELKIWNEIAGVNLASDGVTGEDIPLRDRLIKEQADAGVSATVLSNAFGIKRATVERIIGRLTAAEEESRKAV